MHIKHYSKLRKNVRVTQSQNVPLSCLSRSLADWLTEAAYRDILGLSCVRAFSAEWNTADRDKVEFRATWARYFLWILRSKLSIEFVSIFVDWTVNKQLLEANFFALTLPNIRGNKLWIVIKLQTKNEFFLLFDTSSIWISHSRLYYASNSIIIWNAWLILQNKHNITSTTYIEIKKKLNNKY